MVIETGKELAQACLMLAQNHKTLYVMGCFGAPMTDANKERYIAHHAYNRRAARTALIRAASKDTFGFDCVCMIKGLLWGWGGDLSHNYGGASYASNGVPDVSADQLIKLCRDVSSDFGNIQPGEVLWMKGHVGIYVGNGNAVECTPSWKNGVQITAVKNICPGTGHTWTKHGKLPYITYEAAAPVTDLSAWTALPVLKRGAKGDGVKILQALLNSRIRSCLEIDGSYGPATENAVRSYQVQCALDTDGYVGPKTWMSLLPIE